MKSNPHRLAALSARILPLALLCALPAAFPSGGCGGGTGAGNPGNVALQSAPLSGPNAAWQDRPTWLFNGLMDTLLGSRPAFATVSSFTSFKMCNDTFVMTDTSGNTVPINGQASEAGLGLLTFSPTSTSAMALVYANVAAGAQIQEIDITTAVKPDVCGGANYAVQFDPGSGPISITQNTAFKFQFSTPVTISGTTASPQTLTLLFGQIVNGMVSLGTGLNNSTIQTVNVGSAR
jgi:hypothetical protein